MKAPVTQAYLLGIREGRSLLHLFQADGIADGDTFRAALANAEALYACGFAGEMRDTLRGERDFWRAQVRRLVLED